MGRHIGKLVVLLACLLGMAQALPAEAVPGKGGRKVGLGLEGGRGAGLSVKLDQGGHALQFGLSGARYGRHWRYGFYSSGLIAHADYLVEGGLLTRGQGLELPWYAGGGIDLGLGYGTAVGAHAALGMAFEFKPFPLDFALEWAPTLWIDDGLYIDPVFFRGMIRVWF